jgi:hypothetical protein
MRIALLHDSKSGYGKFMLKVCEAVGAEAVTLQWTQDLEKDLEQIRDADVDYVMIHGHYSHHGLRLAPLVLEQLKIPPLVVSTAWKTYPIEYPISRVGTDNEGFREAVAEIQSGMITNGSSARWVIQQVLEIKDQLATVRHALQIAEQAERNAQESQHKYLQLCEEIRKRQKQRQKDI